MGEAIELTAFPSFEELTAEGRALLDSGLGRAACEPDSLVVQKGDAVSGAYVVLSGRLRVFAIGPDGTEATLYFIDPGETCVLALNCLFNDLLYPAWVQAEGATTVGIIPGPVYRDLFRKEAAVQDVTVRALSTVVFRLMSELEQLHCTDQRQRLANFVLRQAGSDQTLHMTQQRLAGHLGTTREVIARLVGDLVAERLVQTRRGAIRIVDVAGLRRVATQGD